MVYNVNFAARIRSDVDIAALRRGFQALIDRHPSSYHFSVRDGKPAQQVHQARVHFVETDASAWDSETEKPPARGSLSSL